MDSKQLGSPGFIQLTLGETEFHSVGGRKHFQSTHQEVKGEEGSQSPAFGSTDGALALNRGLELSVQNVEWAASGFRKEVADASMPWDRMVHGEPKTNTKSHQHMLQKPARVSRRHPRLCYRRRGTGRLQEAGWGRRK